MLRAVQLWVMKKESRIKILKIIIKKGFHDQFLHKQRLKKEDPTFILQNFYTLIHRRLEVSKIEHVDEQKHTMLCKSNE